MHSRGRDIDTTSTSSTTSITSTAETRIQTIHYFYYTEYDKLARLGFDLMPPKKIHNTYIALLRRPIYFTLPKSEIIEIYECNYTGQNRLKYVVNESQYGDLLHFLDNIDSHCIELSHRYSQEWFKRQYTRNQLVEQYCNVYDRDPEEEDESIFEVVVEKDSLIDKLVDYNRSSSMNLMVCIKGIEFFKDKFQWYITLEKLVYVPKEEVAISASRQGQGRNSSFRYADAIDEENDEEDGDSDDSSDSDGYNDSGSESDNESDNDYNTEDSGKNIQVDTRKEERVNEKREIDDLQERIRQYSEESKRLFLNAERSRKASDMYYQRASYLQNQVRKYEEQLRSGKK
jgi:hypothetical protein